ncbi:MAG TPA: FtsX-like permease family protein, partial [Chthoniobacteraceae bacterium]|nr:FtsX-like permease family protein [Chthoniobacteraceae bacterium]
IIDEAFARRFFPGADPISRQINNLGKGGERRHFTIVGVVPTVRRRAAIGDSSLVQLYYPAAQYPSLQTTLLVRTAGDPLGSSRAVRQAVLAVDSRQPVFDLRPMQSWVDDSLITNRLAATLVGLFSSLALLLAALGLYGTLAYTVAQRTKEIGIRMALGAQRSQMLGMILRQSLTIAAIGIAVGLIGAFTATRLLRALLFGVGTMDLLTYSAVILLLGAAAFLAGLLPARRAMKVDPVIALRSE